MTMPVLVRIPTPLRSLTGGSSEIHAKAGTVSDLVEDLSRQFPGIRERLVDDHGALRRFVNVYVNEEDIRFLQGGETALKDGDQVSIVPAIAGGS
jgi:molybdopterin synthase sulfur carrier subunit